MKLESYGLDWYYFTYDIGKLVISIIHNYKKQLKEILAIISIFITIIITGNNIDYSTTTPFEIVQRY